MKPKRFTVYSGLIISFIFICTTTPALGLGNKQEWNKGWKDEIQSDQLVLEAMQVSSNATTLFLPLIQSPKKLTARVNVPYFNDDIVYPQTAVFWLGKVTPTDNYADVRIGYNDTELYVNVTVFDRLLWYDKDPMPGELTDWDAATLYINLNGDSGSSPGTATYKFDSQLNWWEADERWQASYRGNNSGWDLVSIPFTATSGWRGNAPNDNSDDRGWTVTYRLPFTSLGLSGPPSDGTIWGLAVTVHDRDDLGGTPISDKLWPPTLTHDQPDTWGQLRFGMPIYPTPPSSTTGATSIRHRSDGAVVIDAEVGGHTICGADYSPTFFDGWGDANYAGYEKINIQNQADVSDWPCFSKFFINFPLDDSLSGKEIISANLRIYQFGGSDPVNAKPSLIQVMTVGRDWQEGTITWNNAPLAQENVSQAWAYPILDFPGWPGVPIDWDVSRAVSEAVKNGEPLLRLMLYEADAAQHSGKYFITSDIGEWDELGRPTLSINWGQ